MADLEFGIGRLKLNSEVIKYEGLSPYHASHKFVVEAIDNKVLIYSCVSARHRDVVKSFCLNPGNIVGGGSLYLDSRNLLTLDDLSIDYGRIPSKAAYKFAELILPALRGQNIVADGIMPMPSWTYMFDINAYWDYFEL
jgi:hypothetical protein